MCPTCAGQTPVSAREVWRIVATSLKAGFAKRCGTAEWALGTEDLRATPDSDAETSCMKRGKGHPVKASITGIRLRHGKRFEA